MELLQTGTVERTVRLDPRTKLVLLVSVSTVLLIGGNGTIMDAARTMMLLAPFGLLAVSGRRGAAAALLAAYAGAQALKIFPSSAFGPQYIKALKAVLPQDIPVFAVGGVTPENLAQWIDAGCAGAGLGSDLYRAGQSVERTAQQAAAFVKAYREAVQ